MELSGSNIKKIIFSQKKAFLIFQEMETPKKIFQERETLKNYLYSRKWNFLIFQGERYIQNTDITELSYILRKVI